MIMKFSVYFTDMALEIAHKNTKLKQLREECLALTGRSEVFGYILIY